MSDLAYRAMVFARAAHAGQVRKYTGNPYVDHLAEVAGIVSAVAPEEYREAMVAVAWLHDCMEDQGVEYEDLSDMFGPDIARGVLMLSDLETGNRAARKAASRFRLQVAAGWVQTIKCADLISNTSSIVKHDPKFAVTYLAEKRALLEVMTKADRRLHEIATGIALQAQGGSDG